MQASEIASIVEESTANLSPETRETAARLSALMRHVFAYDRGHQLRVIEDSGLTMTQCKALLELGGLGGEESPRQVSELADAFSVSVPSMSRAVDALVKAGYVTRLEDPEDRRVRRVAITGKGKKLVDTILVVRLAGLQAFAESLTAAQRRKLDAAVDSLMDREDISQTFEHLKEVRP